MRYSLILGALLSIACGSSGSAPKARDARAEEALKDAVKRRDLLEEEFAAATPEHRQRCEFQAGDCRLEIAERRTSLLEAHPTDRCRSITESKAQLACVLEELAASGDAKTSVGYYEYEAQCLQELLGCTGKVVAQTASAQKQAELEKRRERVEGSKEGIELLALVPFAKEKAAYLRSALPPSDDAVCQSQARFQKCDAESKSLADVYEQQLEKSDPEYRDTSALKAFAASKKGEAKCYKPDLECLTRQLERYGGNGETRRFLKESLESLERRERLVAETGAPVAEPCLNGGVQRHQEGIVQSYQRFVKDPGTYFQAQLHRSFRGLYDAQVKCLQGLDRQPILALAALTAAAASERPRDSSPVRVAGTGKSKAGR